MCLRPILNHIKKKKLYIKKVTILNENDPKNYFFWLHFEKIKIYFKNKRKLNDLIC